MAGSENFLIGMLAGLDIEESTKIIEQGVARLAEQITETVKVKLDLDESSVQQIQKQIAKMTGTGASIGSQVVGPTGNVGSPNLEQDAAKVRILDEISSKYSDLNLKVVKFNRDVDDGFIKAKVAGEDLNGVVREFSVIMGDASKKVEIIDVTEFEKYEAVIRKTKTEMTQLGAEASRAIREDNTELLTQKQQELTAALQRSKTVLDNRYADGAIKEKEYQNQLSQVVGVYEKVERSMERAYASKAIKEQKAEAKDLINVYQNQYKIIDEIEKARSAGTVSERFGANELQEAKEMVAEIENEAKSQEALNLKIKEYNEKRADKQALNAIKQEKAEVEALSKEMIATMEQQITLTERYNAEFRKGKGETVELRDRAQALEENEQKLQSLVSTMNTQTEGTWAPETIENFNRLQAEIDQTKEKQNALNQEFQAGLVKKYGEEIKTAFSGAEMPKFSNEVMQSTEAMKQLVTQVGGADANFKSFNAAQNQISYSLVDGKGKLNTYKITLDQVNQVYRQTQTGSEQARTQLLKFGESIRHITNRMLQWVTVGKLFHGSVRQIREGFRFIGELDKELTQVAIIQRTGRENVQGLAQDYAELAREMKVSIGAVSNLTTELTRQGLAMDEAQARMQTMIKLSRAGMVSTEDSLRIITAAVNAMQVSHENAGDVMLRTSQITASSVEQIGEAFSKTASSAYAAGVSLEETASLLSGMIQTTQEGASQIGTSLKTILARFNAINQETGEINEDLNKVQTAFESVGIQFTDQNGQIRNAYDLLGDLSGIWETLDKNTQSYIATVTAGVRMQSRFFAIMTSFDDIGDTLDELTNSAGVLDEAYETALTGVEAAAAEAQAALEGMWVNTLSSDFMIKLYEFQTMIITITDKIGLLNIVVAALATAVTILAKKGIVAMIASLKSANHQMHTYLASLTKTEVATTRLSIQQAGLIKQFKLMSVAVGTAWKAKAGLLVVLGKIAFAIAPVAVGIGALLVAFTSFRKNTDEATISMDEMNSRLEESARKASSNAEQIEKLSEEYKELKSLENLTANESERLQRIQNEIAEMMPNLVDGYDEFGNAIVTAADNQKVLNEELTKMSQEQAAQDLKNLSEAYESLNNEIEENNDKIREARENADSETFNIGIGRFDLQSAEEARQTISEILQEIEDGSLTTGEALARVPDEFRTAAMTAQREGVLEEYLSTTVMEQLDFALQSLNESFRNNQVSMRGYSAEQNELLSQYTTLFENLYLQSREYGILTEQEMQRIRDSFSLENEDLLGLDGLLDPEKVKAHVNAIQTEIEKLYEMLGEDVSQGIKDLNAEFQLGEMSVKEFNQALAGLLAGADNLEDGFIKTLRAIQDGTLDVGDAFKDLENPMTSFFIEAINGSEDTAESVYTVAEAVIEVAESFQDSTSALQKYNEILYEANEGEGLSIDRKLELLDLHPEMIHAIDDEARMLELLMDVQAAEAQNQINMFYEKIEGSNQFINKRVEGEKTLGEKLAEFYGMDAQNWNSLAEAKGATEEHLISQLSKAWANYYRQRGEFTDRDIGIVQQQFEQASLTPGREREAAQLQSQLAAMRSLQNFDFNFQTISLDFAGVLPTLDSFNKATVEARREQDRAREAKEKNKKATKDSNKEERQFAETINLVERRLSRLNDTIEDYTAFVEIAKTQSGKETAIKNLMQAEEERVKLLTSSIKDYDRIARRAFSELPRELRKMVETGKSEQALLQITTAKYGDKAEAIAEVIKEYDQWSDASRNLQVELRNTQQELRNLRIERFNAQFMDTNRQLDQLNHIAGLSGLEKGADNIEQVEKKISVLMKQMKTVEKSFKDLNKQYKDGKISTSDYIAVNESMLEQQRQIENSLNAQYSTLKTLEQDKLSAVTNVENKIVEMIRKRVEIQKNSLNEELQAFRDAANEQLRILDDQYDQEQYTKEVQKEREKMREIQKRIDELSKDDSISARNEVARLREQLLGHEENLERMSSDRQRQLKRQEINDRVSMEEERVNEKITELDRELENERIFLEARKALIEGVMRDIDGEIVTLQQAYVKFENRFGSGMSYLGGTMKKEFQSEIRLATSAVRTMESSSNNSTNSMRSVYQTNMNQMRSAYNNFNSSMIAGNLGLRKNLNDSFRPSVRATTTNMNSLRTSSNNVRTGLNNAANAANNARNHTNNLRGAVNNGRNAYNAYKNAIDAARRAQEALNRTPARTGGSNNPSGGGGGGGGGGLTERMGYRSGGVVDYTGPAMLHGTKDNPEMVLNSGQIDRLFSLLNTPTMVNPKTMKPEPLKGGASQGSGSNLSIANLINIQGDVDKNSIPQIEKIANQVVEKLNRELKNKGIKRVL